MKDFKTLPKMKVGGKVKHYSDGKEVISDKTPFEKVQAESRTYQKEGVPANPTAAQMPATRMTRIANYFQTKPAEVAVPAKKRGGKMKKGCK